MLGVTQQRVHQLIIEQDDFPQPIADLAIGQVWERAAIVEWMERTGRRMHRGRRPHDDPQP